VRPQELPVLAETDLLHVADIVRLVTPDATVGMRGGGKQFGGDPGLVAGNG